MACKDCVHAKDPMPGFPNQFFCDYIYLHISALPYYDTSERCDGYNPKTTYADRFRAMTDEGLAEWFAEHDAGLIANVLNNDYVAPTKGGWLEWLKEEREGE